MGHTNYMRHAFNDDIAQRDTYVEKGINFINNYAKDCDCIVVRGMSGFSLGPMVAFAAKRGIALVRKKRGDGHSSTIVESPDYVKKYIIVDDFVSSGATIYAITEAMKQEHENSVCLGVYEYARDTIRFADSSSVEKKIRKFKRECPEEAKSILRNMKEYS